MAAPLRPMSLPDHAEKRGSGDYEYKLTPATAGTDIPVGYPIVTSSGLAAVAAFDSNTIDDSQVIFAITTEPYRQVQRTAGSVPIQQTTVGIQPCIDGIVECNYYYDGLGTANDTTATALLGSLLSLSRVAHTTYGYIIVADGATTTTSHLTARVIGFVDPVGTVFGRLRLMITYAFRL